MYIKTREPHPWGAAADKAPTTHTGEHNTTAPLHQLPMPVPALCTRPLFHFQKKKAKQKSKTKQNKYRAKKKRKEKKIGGGGGRNHQQHMQTAHSARTGEQAPSGPGHRTRTCTEGSKGTGRNGLHPQGRTHWGDQADPPGQWQERYSKATGPSPARLHRGPWQTSPGAMEATGDRRAGTQPTRGSPAKQWGPATGATGVRRSYRRLAGAIPLVVRDTPYGWAAPRAAAHRRRHVTLPTDTCGDRLSPGTPGPGGRDTAFPSTCRSSVPIFEAYHLVGHAAPFTCPYTL